MSEELINPSDYYDEDLIRWFLLKIQGNLAEGIPTTDLQVSTLLNLVSIIGQERNELRRRTLSAEERLEKAVELLVHQKYCQDCAESWGSCEVGRECQEFVDRPKAIRPSVQCAPPSVTDVPPEMALTKAVNLLNDGSFPLGGDATLVEGRWWFRHDTDDSTTQANEEVLRDLIAPELAEYGLELEDPCIEHDCISGFMKLT